MSPIKIPLHLLIPTVVSLACLIFLLLKRNTFRKKSTALYKSGLVFLFAYALLLGNALGHDIYYQWDVNRYDLNQDGFFSESEATSGQVLALERLTNNTTRNSASISTLIAAGILALCVYLLIRLNHALFEADENDAKNNHLTNIHTY